MVTLIKAAPVLHKGAERKQLHIPRFGLLFLAALVFLTSAFVGCGGGVSTKNEPPQSATGSATLTWEAPAKNVDGTDLTDLKGFKVYYGVTSNSYTYVNDVGNVSSCQVAGLVQGLTYYFSVTAYDTSWNESGYSNELSKLVY